MKEPLPRTQIEQNIHAVEQVHAEHHESATPVDKLLEQIKAAITQPASVFAVAFVILAWIAENVGFRGTSWAFDPAPFPFLNIVMATLAVMITILILATQRRADRLAAHREQLILQLALASEQKAAKMIALLEELRIDMPQVTNRPDAEAAEMSEASDPLAVSQALRESEHGLERDASRT